MNKYIKMFEDFVNEDNDIFKRYGIKESLIIEKSENKLYKELDSMFSDLAKKSKTPEEFIEGARKIKNVPPEIANFFSEKFGGGSMEDAAKNYMDYIKKKS